MVNVGDKPNTHRIAIATGSISMLPATFDLVEAGNHKKGDVLGIARIAGIQASKKTSDLIPLCHPLPLTKVTIDLQLQGTRLVIRALCKTTGKTGVEMEALTAASVAALTVYDMCKGLDKGLVIEQTRLLGKTGGKSGHWQAEDAGVDEYD